MSDLSDVEIALKGLIVGWVYPSGTSEPSAVPGAIPVKVGRGWPLRDSLVADIAAGVANITVYSQPGSERLTSRFPREWQTLAAPAATITATVVGLTIILGGVVATPQNVAAIVNRKAYVYAVQAADTLSTIAAALAADIAQDTPATSTGSAISIPGAYSLQARAALPATAIRELRRQERLFQITCWCSSPEQRDALAAFIDAKFAGSGSTDGLEFIALPDGSGGRLKYARTAPTDKDELSGSFRRDLIYSVEYPTTETANFPTVIAFETRLTDTAGVSITDQTT